MHIILIFLPLLFQIIFGRKAIGGDIKLSFGTVCLISFFGQILSTILEFNIILSNLQKKSNFCGLPLVGLITVSLFLTFILIITIFIQDRIRKSYGYVEEIDAKDDDEYEKYLEDEEDDTF
jgi:TRAP-type C4-dicarboxylate transport system permease small subunit